MRYQSENLTPGIARIAHTPSFPSSSVSLEHCWGRILHVHIPPPPHEPTAPPPDHPHPAETSQLNTPNGPTVLLMPCQCCQPPAPWGACCGSPRADLRIPTADPGRRPCSLPAAGSSGSPDTFCMATRTGGSGCCRSPGSCGHSHPYRSHLHHVVWESVWPRCQSGGNGAGPRLLPPLGRGDALCGSP